LKAFTRGLSEVTSDLVCSMVIGDGLMDEFVTKRTLSGGIVLPGVSELGAFSSLPDDITA